MTNPWLWTLAALIGGYLVGSLSFAVIVSRAMGLADPRSYGSKSSGATNVLRSGNKQAAALTLAFDVLKGYLPVLAVMSLLLIWKHEGNIRRLLAGTESRLGSRVAAAASATPQRPRGKAAPAAPAQGSGKASQ